MAEISASMVMDLRQRTGLGMMECKKALAEAEGDMTKAEDLLRIKTGAKASKAAGRVAAEGVIGLWVAPDAKLGAMVEVNCETDFVARNDDFNAFAQEIAQIVAATIPPTSEALGAARLASGETVEARRVALVQKIGENMSIRRFVRTVAKGTLASYVHGVKIGVLVDVTAATRRRQGRRDAHGGRRRSGRHQAHRRVAQRGSRRAHREGARDLHRAGRRKRQARGDRRQDGRGPRQQVPGRSHAARPAVRQESDETVEKYLKAQGRRR